MSNVYSVEKHFQFWVEEKFVSWAASLDVSKLNRTDQQMISKWTQKAFYSVFSIVLKLLFVILVYVES